MEAGANAQETGEEAHLRMADQPNSWVARYAKRERRRREEAEVFRKTVDSFTAKLLPRLRNDIREYNQSFPEEAAHIKVQAGAPVSIQRLADADSKYEGILPEVQFYVDPDRMIFDCRFMHNEELNREFALVLEEDGSCGLAENSIEFLSEYLLAPVLFNKLTSRSSANDPGPSQEDLGLG